VADTLLVELKACRAIAPEHTAQILGYLRACRTEHGLLINFGAPRLEIRKYVLSQPRVSAPLAPLCGNKQENT
jgi:GxxExxY protein